MAYEIYNPNPMMRNVGDCSVRAVSKALGIDWETAYIKIMINGYSMCDMPSSAAVDEYFNVTSTAIITVPKGCCFSISVENVSEGATAADTPTAINVQNANLVVSRIA